MNKRASGVAKAQRAGISMSSVVAVVVVALLAAVVIGGVLLTSEDRGEVTSGSIPVAASATSYPTTVQDGVIVAGGPAANVVDVYEDPLCPACAVFEERAGEPIGNAIAQGRVQVRFHMVNLLETASSPQGYSSSAGNALMCAAENGAFPTVHRSLYAAQPSERGPGYSTEQLVGLGEAAGAGPGYAPCVREGRHIATIATNFEQARNDPALQRQGGFGTPTIVVDGRLQEPGSTELNELID